MAHLDTETLHADIHLVVAARGLARRPVRGRLLSGLALLLPLGLPLGLPPRCGCAGGRFGGERLAPLRQRRQRSSYLYDRHPELVLVFLHQLAVQVQLRGIQGLGDALLELADALAGHLFGGGQFHFLDRLAGGLLDGAQQAALAIGREQDGVTLPACPAGATDAVHVGFDIVGDVVIDHVTDARHVQAAGRHVGGHQDIQVAILEALHGLLPLLLRDITVESRGRIAPRRQFVGQLSGQDTGAHEYDHAVEVLDLENTGQGIEFVHPRHHPHALADGGIDHGFHFYGDFLRVAQVALGDAADGIGHGGGKQRYLALGGGLLQDPLDIVDEAHAQHFIGLVQNQGLQLAQLERAPPHVIHYPARCTHHHVHTPFQLAQLAAHIGAAIDGQHMETRQVTGILLEGLRHLYRQLPGGRQHQHLGLLLLEVQARQDRQRESGGFAGAGLRLAKHVGARQHMGNDSALDGRGSLITDLLQGFLQGRGQIQFRETGYPIGSGHAGTLSGERGAPWARPQIIQGKAFTVRPAGRNHSARKVATISGPASRVRLSPTRVNAVTAPNICRYCRSSSDPCSQAISVPAMALKARALPCTATPSRL